MKMETFFVCNIIKRGTDMKKKRLWKKTVSMLAALAVMGASVPAAGQEAEIKPQAAGTPIWTMQ